MSSARKVTNRVIELAEEGIITWESIAMAALCYMSEDDVADMAHDYEWPIEEEQESDDDETDTDSE